MAGFRVDFSVLLESVGFVKILEWILAIFTLTTCGGFQGETTILVSCKGVVNKTITAVFAYPFRNGNLLCYALHYFTLSSSLAVP
uniref:Synaptophysin like 1 n=1 Tax=Malurus cyaneus samueli TaxID=2593467 RepID=A0A8C5TW56_9PASS